MKTFLVTFKRIEAFYTDIVIEADTQEEAREIADTQAIEGIEFDYLQESDLIDEHIYNVKEI